MRVRTAASLGVLALVVLALCACSVRVPGQASLETAIPEAFLASDLGITGAQAGTRTSGASVSVWASAEFDTDAVTSDDLRTMLELAVENTDLSSVDRLSVLASVGPFQDDVYIDLGTLGVELGFDTGASTTFEARWDDVVDFLDE